MSNLLFLRRPYAYRNAAVETLRKARAMPPGPERRAARQLARALTDLAKTEAWLEGQTLHCGLTTGSTRVAPSALELEMSNRRTCAAQDRTFDTDNFVRCPRCQRWFYRSDPITVAEHRGPLPHPVQNPRTAWADEDDEGGLGSNFG
jgi:hypothetical protein